MLFLLLASCWKPGDSAERSPEVVHPGGPVAGVAEIEIDFAMGSPLGGYTGRCNCFGGASNEVDDRDSAYVTSFNVSAGVQTRPRAQALWLENGDQQIVILKADLIYTSDEVVGELEQRLSDDTGVDMMGKVVLSASHTHHAPANWHSGLTWWLGGDRVDRESFERLTGSLEEVALAAWNAREPAAIGLGLAKDWDPDDLVYRDRRDENNDTLFFDDIPAGSYKDPNLVLLRVDTSAGQPMGVFYSFGMHGTVLGGDNQMWSGDAISHVEWVVQERFDTPVVVAHWQGAGGDASPSGTQDGYAHLETIGEYAVDAIYDLWQATPVSTEAIRLETVTHAIDQSRDKIHVTRAGTTDLYYAPYVSKEENDDFEPDEILYNSDGRVASPIDEFNTQYGGAFCGADLPLIPGVSVGSTTYPYSSCIDVGTISSVIAAFFDLSQDDLILPMPESLRAQATATRLGPLPIHEADGTEVADDVLFAFFPGEPLAVYTEQFRRRALAELGLSHAFPVGYAQDHEGYLLTPEDWLLGGYEPNINIWGPLQGEYIMEGVLDMSARWLLTDALEPLDPTGRYQPTDYVDFAVLPIGPDLTPAAGTPLDELPEYLYQPLEGLAVRVAPEPTLERVSGLAQFAWVGGDPGVDLPRVSLQRQESDSSWTEVTTHAGRALTEAMPDILLTHTPHPLYPADALQTHTWWAAWQVVGHVQDRMGVPVGTYRLHVEGHTSVGGGTGWPWPATAYELDSDPFEVLPAEMTLSISGESLLAWVPAPAWGYRLVDMEGSAQGANPVHDVVLTWELSDGSEVDEEVESTIAGGVTILPLSPPSGAVSVVVTDRYGNTGSLDL